ncbi:MAG: hypothetical protein FJ189_11315, partial [Gammaproteobacteria bacterium]|nr:hypothetical protein [Gammaproteobacteria bacterium]
MYSGITPRWPARRWCRVFLAFLLQALSWAAIEARAAEVRLVWDPVANAEGYRIHYGTSSGHYSMRVDVGNVSACRLPGFREGVTYFFAATAYNRSGVESGFSNEVTTEIPDPTLPVVDFTAGPRLGMAPLTVRFQEASAGDI